ncbi:hypothetical protein K466DRAFT_582641 [Polyporus arcularius HHB13444]|uniref:Uncharacterized protein n=1 Tax=Polyporus arcularius HHB13444 TaxID=1314778 RepID=A0A5C3PUT9_9APHY|nr:hypothetical protein K466DRAFT_582641 [Polyporus arcularius HHB13444]
MFALDPWTECKLVLRFLCFALPFGLGPALRLPASMLGPCDIVFVFIASRFQASGAAPLNAADTYSGLPCGRHLLRLVINAVTSRKSSSAARRQGSTERYQEAVCMWCAWEPDTNLILVYEMRDG